MRSLIVIVLAGTCAYLWYKLKRTQFIANGGKAEDFKVFEAFKIRPPNYSLTKN